jgi:hypothetical protein
MFKPKDISKVVMFLLVFTLLFSFISAKPPGTTTIYFESGYTIVSNPQYLLEQNQPNQINFFVYNTSNGALIDNTTVTCNFFLADNKGEVIFFGKTQYFTDGHWGIDVAGGNFSRLGEYGYGINCQDGGLGGALSGVLQVTTDGNENNLQRGVISIALILFFILLGVGFYFIHSKVDLEKWNSSLLRRYENKNYIKLVLGSIAYNVCKCSFIIYYLIGFPIIVALTDLAYAYSLGNLLDIFEALIVVYAVGVIIVGLIFFSYVQEWLVDLLEKVKDMEWGTE